jgi:hypothetical protein
MFHSRGSGSVASSANCVVSVVSKVGFIGKFGAISRGIGIASILVGGPAGEASGL